MRLALAMVLASLVAVALVACNPQPVRRIQALRCAGQAVAVCHRARPPSVFIQLSPERPVSGVSAFGGSGGGHPADARSAPTV